MSHFVVACLFVLCSPGPKPVELSRQPTLLGMIAEWQYPESKFENGQMSDGATVNPSGERTFASISAKTLMKTDASVEEVLEFYRAKLTPEKIDEMKQSMDDDELSVVFSDDSMGRSFELHTIIVNTRKTSTTLVISRADEDQTTQIAWKYYRRFIQ